MLHINNHKGYGMAFNNKIIFWILVLTANQPMIGWSHHCWQRAGVKQSGPAALVTPRTRRPQASGVVMSILSLPSRLSTFEPAEQFQSDSHIGAESALFELASHVSNLRLGLAPFNVLTPAERAEQLLQLVDTDSFIPVAEHVAQLADERLMSIVADKSVSNPMFIAAARELTARVDAVPTASERERIETFDEEWHRELTLQREWDAAEYQLDTPLHGRTFASLG
jgi:hypothetical protein